MASSTLPSASNPPPSSPAEPLATDPDCLPCRLIGASAATLGGAYVLTEETKRRRAQLLAFRGSIPPRGAGARGMQVIGWGLVALGVARAWPATA